MTIEPFFLELLDGVDDELADEAELALELLLDELPLAPLSEVSIVPEFK